MSALLLTRRLRPRDLFAVDVVLAIVVGAMLAPYAALESPLRGGVDEPVWASVLTGLVIGLPIAVRRRHPVAVAITVSAATAASLATGIIPNFAAAAPAVSVALAFYTLAVQTPPRWSLPTALGCLAAIVAVLATTGGDVGDRAGAALFGAVMTAPGWFAGWTVRERRAAAARQSEQQTLQAVTEERLRIARELHDIVAHTMSLIVVKAAVGNHVAEASPQEARDALRVIETTGRGALLEMRRALGMLREEAAFAPAPGLADLPALAGQASFGGVEVQLEVVRHAPEEVVPESVSLSAYRIVQEAVTNVVQHAAPATCRVTVTIEADEVRVDVTDNGQPTGTATSRLHPATTTAGQGSPGIGSGDREAGSVGHGLIGMRERVGLHGGEFSAGAGDSGGFRVMARLPYERAGSGQGTSAVRRSGGVRGFSSGQGPADVEEGSGGQGFSDVQRTGDVQGTGSAERAGGAVR